MAEVSQGCKSFTDYVIRRQPFYDLDILRDRTPRQMGWVDHVMTGPWLAGTEAEHTHDRITRIMPDLSGCWENVETGHCLDAPCDPTRKEVGWGYERLTYNLQRKAYKTQLLCFNQIQTAAAATEMFAAIIGMLRKTTGFVVSDRYQTEAVRLAGHRVVADANQTPITWTPNADCTEITVEAMPTSVLRIQDLMRWVRPLDMDGYHEENGEGFPPMFEVVTEQESAWRMREGNPELANYVRLPDFEKGGALYKFGISEQIGNFLIRYDNLPLRFQIVNATTLRRVMPYTKVSATSGIKMAVNDDYVNARVQVSFIWHRMGFQSLIRESTQINPAMPFAAQRWNGEWKFVMHDLGMDENGCVIENSDQNKGRFQNEFQFGTKPLHTEFIVAILHLIEQPCLVVQEPCTDDPGYYEQDYTSGNDPCPAGEMTFTPTPAGGPFAIAENSITCNGVPIVHAAVSGATVALLATDLNTKVAILGTWAADGDNITLNDSSCQQVDLNFS